MDIRQLMTFWVAYGGNDPDAAANLFPHRKPGYELNAERLALLAFHRAIALAHQREGLEVSAGYHFKVCDSIYNALPEYARRWDRAPAKVEV